MAPSSRTSAPSTTRHVSTRTSSTRSKHNLSGESGSLKSALNTSSNFGRVTKVRTGRAGLKVKFSDVEKGAFEKWNGDVQEKENQGEEVVIAEKYVQVVTGLTRSSKRKHTDLNDGESERGERSGSEDVERFQNASQKKRRIQRHGQLLSPPASRDGTDCDDESPLSRRSCSKRTSASTPIVELPQSLLDLISMHAAFLKAMSLHYAHNGASSPAELMGLMDSMTRLWKKQNVRSEAVRRMLALYEIAAEPSLFGSKQVQQRQSPFKITTSGLGSNVRTNLEFVGQAPYSENVLQTSYSKMVRDCFQHQQEIAEHTFQPLLMIALGTQTSLHRAKAASTRLEILNLSASAQSRSTPDFSKLSITDSLDHTPAAVKSRTLSLFDRVRAKALASSNNTAPTPEQITRRHAIGRVSEVVEFLRMKQQQKLSVQFQSSIHDSPGKLRGTGKISFSLGAIVRDLRQSVGIPMGEDEIKMCLRILSQEVPGDWCRMIELGSITSITLQGKGMSGVEVKKFLEEKR